MGSQGDMGLCCGVMGSDGGLWDQMGGYGIPGGYGGPLRSWDALWDVKICFGILGCPLGSWDAIWDLGMTFGMLGYALGSWVALWDAGMPFGILG